MKFDIAEQNAKCWILFYGGRGLPPAGIQGFTCLDLVHLVFTIQL